VKFLILGVAVLLQQGGAKHDIKCLLTFEHFINFFLITTPPILFKFDMMYLRDKGLGHKLGISGFLLPWGRWGGAKSVKIDQSLKNPLL
jgi:hypothetical protein